MMAMIKRKDKYKKGMVYRQSRSEAIANRYPTEFSLCEGYVLIDRNHVLVRISEGVAKQFKQQEISLLLERIETVLSLSTEGDNPYEVIEKRFRAMEFAKVKREESFYIGNVKKLEEEVLFFEGVASDGLVVQFYCVFKPLLLEDNLFLIGFIEFDQEESAMIREHAIENKSREGLNTETERRIELANKVATTTGQLTDSSFQWLVLNVFGGSRVARIAAFSLVVGGATSLVIVAAVVALTVIKGPRFFAEIYYEFFRGFSEPQSVRPETERERLFFE